MDSIWEPETREELRIALESLIVQADKNDIIPDETTSFAITHGDTDTPDWEVIISQLRD